MSWCRTPTAVDFSWKKASRVGDGASVYIGSLLGLHCNLAGVEQRPVDTVQLPVRV